MSITSAQRVRLGIFVVVSIVLAVAILIAGVGFKLSQKSATYYSEFKGESLSGLTKGMEVKFHGIPVGKVTNIGYNPEDLTTVTVTLSVNKEFPVKEDMVVETGMLGITGLKYIEIMGGTSGSPLLPEGSFLESKPSLMAAVTDQIGDILIKANIFLDNINTLTDPSESGNLDKILSSVSSLTANLDTLVSGSSPKMDSLLHSLNSTFLKVDKMVDDFSKNSNLTKIMVNIDSTIVSILELTNGFNLTFAQSREDIASTMIDLQETMENLNSLSQLLLENPSLILRGSPQQKRKIK